MRDQAIYNIHPDVIEIRDGNHAFDKDGNVVVIDVSKVDMEALRLSSRQGTLEAIHELEQSIDTSRMRREVFEGMRKQVTGVSPTKAEAWSIAKVQSVDNEIAILRAKLK